MGEEVYGVGSRPRGRPKRTWLEVVQRSKYVVAVMGFSVEDEYLIRSL